VKELIIKFRLLVKYLGKEALYWLLLGSVASFGLSLLEVSISVLMQVLFYKISLLHDIFLPGPMNFLLTWPLGLLCILFGVVGALRAALTLITSQSGNFFSTIINTRLRLMSVYDLLMVYRTKVLPSSEINLRFAEIFPKASNFVASTTNSLIALVQSICIFIAMALIGWREALVGLVGVVLIGSMLSLLKKGILSYSKKVLYEQENINRSIQRITQNWINIKILRTQNEEYCSLVDRLLLSFSHTSRSGLLIKSGAILPGFLGIVLLAFIVYTSNVYFKTTGPTLLAFLYLFLRFVQSLTTTADSYFSALTNFPYFQRAFRIFINSNQADMAIALNPTKAMRVLGNYHPGIWNSDFKTQDDLKRMEKSPDIRIDNIGFRWLADDPYVFENFSLSIPHNSIYGIIGPSGRGKSTLLLLILGILIPEKGSIFISQIPAENYLKDFSADVGYVGPDPFLVAGTIRENLLYGQTNLSLDDNDLTQTLKSVQLDYLITRLDYVVTENAEGLSSGQKQRLSLARTLLRKPKFLILDEASANLDHVTEAHIANLLLDLKKECTIIVVTHREAMIKHADGVLDLNKSLA
jgi:ABC-type multidrug transport system fused ATPase/permease subunit